MDFAPLPYAAAIKTGLLEAALDMAEAALYLSKVFLERF
tara:strand:+ start:706 stop:822 length:117 start_codon:yes stop_codon:yes gene_type:complete